MSPKKKSIKTTVLGIIAIVLALGGAALAVFDDDPTTNLDLPALLAVLGLGGAAVAARDHSVSSKDARV
ncbi:MAG: hypothetical protein IIB57_14565 [Planctomycetes bacterium]|nr:hypothetical protein [Planctomycetota bacterium]